MIKQSYNWIKEKFKKFKKLLFFVFIGGIALAAPATEIIQEEIQWKEFTDNLITINYTHNGRVVSGLKDIKGVWKPNEEDFKEIYKYVYGEDLVPWQTMDGTEMSPLVKMADGTFERTNLIPQWEQEWNNNVERGKGDVLKELRDDVRPGMINSDIKNVRGKSQKNLFGFFAGLIKKAFAGVEFSDTFTEAGDTALESHTPDTGTGYTEIIDTGTCALWIYGGPNFLDANTSIFWGGCSNASGSLVETDDIMSHADVEVSVLQVNGDSFNDSNTIACRVQANGEMYILDFNESDSYLVRRNSDGSWTSLADGPPISDGSTVKLECLGTAIKAYDDGVQIISVTDSTITSAGKAGIGQGAIWIALDDTSSQILDDFEVNVTGVSAVTKAKVPDLIIFE